MIYGRRCIFKIITNVGTIKTKINVGIIVYLRRSALKSGGLQKWPPPECRDSIKAAQGTWALGLPCTCPSAHFEYRLITQTRSRSSWLP